MLEGRNSDWELSKRRPVLPTYVTHQAELRCDIVNYTGHHLLRHFHRNIDLGAANSLAKTGKNGTQIREMRSKAEFVVDLRLISESDAKFGDRPEQYSDVATECFVLRLQPEAAVRDTWTDVVDLRLKEETSA